MDVSFFWLLLALIMGLCARKKGRSFWGFFFLSVIASPLISGVVLAFSNPRNSQ